MSALCSRCGMTIRKKVVGRNKSGGAKYQTVTLLGNPHHCPRAGRRVSVLEQGKSPQADMQKRWIETSAKRVESNTKKGLTT